MTASQKLVQIMREDANSSTLYLTPPLPPTMTAEEEASRYQRGLAALKKSMDAVQHRKQ